MMQTMCVNWKAKPYSLVKVSNPILAVVRTVVLNYHPKLCFLFPLSPLPQTHRDIHHNVCECLKVEETIRDPNKIFLCLTINLIIM